MTTNSSISRHLERQAVAPMDSTIPTDMTVQEWRRQRDARRVVPLRPEPCDHLHDTTTRYDHAEKQLTFLEICPVCGTEKVLETRHYEPQFRPHGASEPAEATVHQLPIRRHGQPGRLAA